MPTASGKPAHRVYAEAASLTVGAVVNIAGQESHHALVVKRVRAGDTVAIHNGTGTVAMGVVGATAGSRREPVMPVEVKSVVRQPAPMHRVEVWSATPKGERAGQLIDQLSQAGASGWRPLATARGVAEASEHLLSRLRRVAVEAMKQCERAWILAVGEEATLASAVEPAVRLVVADAGGVRGAEIFVESAEQASHWRILIGPEGGFTDEELATLESAGAHKVSLGPHVMRIETAAVVGAGIAMAQLHRQA